MLMAAILENGGHFENFDNIFMLTIKVPIHYLQLIIA